MSPVSHESQFAALYPWDRTRAVLILCIVLSVVLWPAWVTSYWSLAARVIAVGLLVQGVFGLAEHWPARLPRWAARWVVQVLCVAVSIPIAVALVYTLATLGAAQPWWTERQRLTGFAMMTVFGLLVAPWIALGAIVRQREALAREQALAFQLERSEYERRSLDARLRLLQAQVEPHFLFNTLANVQALVETGAPQAAAVLRSLIAYLRVAVPRLHERSTSLGQELQLVHAYLEVMRMRMPDRLSYALQVATGVEAVRCPPMTLLTVVENAVRHGVDPSEEGGHIEIAASVRSGRCLLRVADTGVGMQASTSGLGTGLASLRERLSLCFGAAIDLRLADNVPRGVVVEIEFPAEGATP